MNKNLQLERIIFELKRGECVIIYDNIKRSYILLSSTENFSETTFSKHLNFSKSYPNLILSSERSRSLNIITDNPCSLPINLKWKSEDILNIAFGKRLNSKIDLQGIVEEKSEIIRNSLNILKKGRLLPSGIYSIVNRIDFDGIKDLGIKNNLLVFDINDFSNLKKERDYVAEIVTRVKLPIQKTNDSEVVVFRLDGDSTEYFCLIIGKAKNHNEIENYVPTVRVHSQCLTGDVFHSLKCDCGEQLDKSLELMANNNEGILIYLPQEGRNIGLINKLRAYKLQEDGLDTVEANMTLGFKDDERTYEAAIAILKKLDIKEIKLITNNPNKIVDVEHKGIRVTERIGLEIKTNSFNKNYINTKINKAGHIKN